MTLTLSSFPYHSFSVPPSAISLLLCRRLRWWSHPPLPIPDSVCVPVNSPLSSVAKTFDLHRPSPWPVSSVMLVSDEQHSETLMKYIQNSRNTEQTWRQQCRRIDCRCSSWLFFVCLFSLSLRVHLSLLPPFSMFQTFHTFPPASSLSTLSCRRFSIPICRYRPLLAWRREKGEDHSADNVISSHMPLCRARCLDECEPLSPGNDREFRRQARRGCEVGWSHECDFLGGAMSHGYAVGARYVDRLTTVQCLPNVSASY